MIGRRLPTSLTPLLAPLVAPVQRYARWLHTQWPSGTVEPFPLVDSEYRSSLAGVRIAGDLLGVPVLKMAADSGAQAVREILREKSFEPSGGDATEEDDSVDLAIIGGGVAGLSAALEAKKQGLKFRIFESLEPFSTITQFPAQKPIFTYPLDFTPRSQVSLDVYTRETLLASLRQQAAEAKLRIELRRVLKVRRVASFGVVDFDDGSPPLVAKRIVLAIGKSGDFRKLGVPGEELEKVSHRLLDPDSYRGRPIVVIGGGDSAVETAVLLDRAGARVSLVHRGADWSRAKPANQRAVTELSAASHTFLRTEVLEISQNGVQVKTGNHEPVLLPADRVFAMIGREAPLRFFARSNIRVQGLRDFRWWLSFALTFVAITALLRWKTEGSEVYTFFKEQGWFPHGPSPATPAAHPTQSWLQHALRSPGFYYEILYTLLIGAFGLRRIARTPTPYVKRQTLSLFLVQLVPLFLLPYFILPSLQAGGAFDGGVGKSIADAFFPLSAETGLREFWRAVGFILAWPLFLWNVFTEKPLTAWLVVSVLQTFVLIPWLVRRWGKGAYCGWLCSCGALAETLGDSQRHKMPHGKWPNRLNLAGQGILGFVVALLLLRVGSWVLPPQSSLGQTLAAGYLRGLLAWGGERFQLGYAHWVDYFLSGIIGMGVYFHLSGRVWCRFFCPLAAWMNILGRWTRFRIFAIKEKCISCNACTRICHQGVDVMGFAQRGQPVEDPQCVRCSACVTTCPTEVLTLGHLDTEKRPVPDRWSSRKS